MFREGEGMIPTGARGRKFLAGATLALFGMALLAPGVAAEQDPVVSEDPEVPVPSPAEWSGSTDLGSSLYWGSRSQSIITTDGEIERSTDLFDLKLDVSFVYGESEDGEGIPLVSKRTWDIELNTDYEPNQPLRTYLVASWASSYEKRYDSRWNVGVGGKYSLSQERGRKVEFSFAVELEKTSPSERAKRRDGDDDVRGRWSTTVNIDRNLIEDRLQFTSKTDWKPEYNRFDTFTATSRNTLALAVTETVDFKITLVESYDSESTARGADQNADGRLVFGISTSFR